MFIWNHLNAAVVYGSNWSHFKMLSIENLIFNLLGIGVITLFYHLTGDGGGKYRSF